MVLVSAMKQSAEPLALTYRTENAKKFFENIQLADSKDPISEQALQNIPNPDEFRTPLAP